MSGFSDYWENEILDHLFDKGVYSPPTIYVALSTADPGDDGVAMCEPAGNSYARVATSNADWTSAVGSVVGNADAIEFAQAAGVWGTITHFALYDMGAGGHLLAHGPLDQPITVEVGDRVRFPPGELTVTLD
jgi:hypothetical protein